MGMTYDVEKEYVCDTGVIREKDKLYFIDREGYLCWAPMQHKGRKRATLPKHRIKKVVDREKGYIYYPAGKVGEEMKIYRFKAGARKHKVTKSMP